MLDRTTDWAGEAGGSVRGSLYKRRCLGESGSLSSSSSSPLSRFPESIVLCRRKRRVLAGESSPAPAGWSFVGAMGNLAAEDDLAAAMATGKPRVLCLHGFRTSGEIMRTQVVGKWPEAVTSRLDLFFADAPFPAEGKSEVEGIFPGPYYEWFQFDKEFKEYRNFDECLNYIEELMIQHGPFDGLMGFSQGAILSAALPGLQAKGLALTRVPKLKFVMIIGGAKFASPVVAEMAYSEKISCPSLHFLGEMDFLRPHGEVLLESYEEPVVIHHPKGHTVPRLLEEKSLETVMSFLKRIEKAVDRSDLSIESIEAASAA